MHKIKTTRLNMVLPEWLKQAVQENATAKGISMTAYVLDAVKEAVLRDKINKNN